MIRVTKLRIPALPTEKPRRLYVYTPRGYAKSQRRYPVLYMFDGYNVFYDSHATYGKSWGMKQFLDRSGFEVIVVAIECNHEGNRRLSEYTPWPFARRPFGTVEAQGETTMDWLVHELKGRIDAEYRTLPDREHSLIAGSSMGGLMAVYAAVAYNEYFSRAAALSPCLWLDPGAAREMIRAHPLRSPTRIYLDMGGAEAAGHPRMISAMFDAAKALSKAGADVDARVAPGARHCEADWEKRIPVFFEYLLDDPTN